MSYFIRVYRFGNGQVRISAEARMAGKRTAAHWRNVDLADKIALDEQGFYLLLNAVEAELKGWLF